MSSDKNLDNVDNESYEINRMNMSDDKDSDERDQMSKNYEIKLSDIIEHLKPGKLSSHKIYTMLRNNMIK